MAVLTVMGGWVVYAAGPFKDMAPGSHSGSAGWFSIAAFGGYGAPLNLKKAVRAGEPFLPEHRHPSLCHGHGCMYSAFGKCAAFRVS